MSSAAPQESSTKHVPTDSSHKPAGTPATATKVDSPINSNPQPFSAPVTTAKMDPGAPANTHPAFQNSLTQQEIGFIDLETLGKIYDSLCQSESQEDVELAAWVKQHYLHEPIGESEHGRSIKTREGFSKLDTAYRRVRHLTNKAQDKWPFFDRNWKKMQTGTVRKIAQGELNPLSDPSGAGRQLLATPKQDEVATFDCPTELQKASSPEPLNATSPAPTHSTARLVSEPMNGTPASFMSTPDRANQPRLAAEAEPIKTNLDNLPPGSLKRKRGAGFTAGQRKKHNGGRGAGGVGRFRKSESHLNESEDGTPPSVGNSTTTSKGTGKTSDSSKGTGRTRMLTRQSARQSARVSGGAPEAPRAPSQALSEKAQASAAEQAMPDSDSEPKPASEVIIDEPANDSPMPDVGSDEVVPSTEAHQLQDASRDDSVIPTSPNGPSAEDLFKLAMSRTAFAQLSVTPDRAQTPSQSLNAASSGSPVPIPAPESSSIADAPLSADTVNKTIEPATNPHPDPTIQSVVNQYVNFIARVDTPAGAVEIALPVAALASDPELVGRIVEFARWRNNEGSASDLNFELYTSIVVKAPKN